MSAYTIRDFTPDDYEALADVTNAVYADYPRTASELRYDDETRDPKCLFRRWLAVRDGEPIGMSFYGQFAESYHPRTFWIGVDVRPEQRRRGVGAALYERALAAVREHEPEAIRAETREDWADAVRFMTRRGFVEEQREWESRLDVAAFDPTPVAGAEERVRAGGIELKTLADLTADPDHARKLHALEWELELDVPNPETPTPISLEQYVETRLKRPELLLEGWIVAVHDGEYVGMSVLWASAAGPDLETGLTGVRRAYRRRGIALALKLRAIAYAKAAGRPSIKTWNEVANVGMLGINERLGFVRQPAWILAVKHDVMHDA
jgi:GNAT superfamily N-acetyltransferase